MEAEDVLVEGGLRELRLRVQDRRRAAAPHNALREGLLRHRLRPLLRPRRHGRGGGTCPACAAAPSGPTESRINTGRRDRTCQSNNGSSRGERGRNWRAGRAGISPGREDGDGADVARLVDLKLHGLLPGAGSSEEAAVAVVIAAERRAAEQEQSNGNGWNGRRCEFEFSALPGCGWLAWTVYIRPP